MLNLGFPVRPVLASLFFAALFSLFTFQTAIAAEQPSKPNVVLILADDLGWADLGCYGADLHESPRIDRLATEGVRFTNAYAMSVCSPSRAALMTGKHAVRIPITIWSEGSLRGPQNRPLLQARSLHDLPHEEVTLAERFHDAGYLTAAVGKWHLGDAAHFPETQGFDINIGGTMWGAPETFFWPFRGRGRFGNEFRYVPDLGFGKPEDYLTDRLTDKALEIIDDAGEKPFFLYLAYHSVHTPIEGKPEYVAHFKEKLRGEFKHQNATYAAMVKSLDGNVGRVLDHLDQKGLAGNTIVILASDNGGYVNFDKGTKVPVTNNAPLRSGKGSLYEGGVRIPMIVRWPGLTPKGKVCEMPVVLMDVFPTLSTILPKPTKPQEQTLDGIDLTQVLSHPDQHLDRGPLYFHYPHYYPTTTPVGSIRDGDWKLLEYFEDNHVELYYLASDLSEQNDLAEKQPEKANELRQKLHDWRARVGAEMPTPNQKKSK